MGREQRLLIDELAEKHSPSLAQVQTLLEAHTDADTVAYAARKADELRRKIYGDEVYIRGLIEISNYCRNDCYYCGIRRSNRACHRYRLSPRQILECTDKGYELGFRTFVLQGGEDNWFTDERLLPLIEQIKARHSDCALTLSLGERSKESYQRLFDAGADRYLLRHETADAEHYRLLHPSELSWERRMECLHDLRDIGFQTGCGFMVGSPGQTGEMLAKELLFLAAFRPHMCGIGPFIPHKDTPFSSYPAGTLELTCYLLSLIRLICPTVLLPSTTALGTIAPNGRELGLQAGANVVMPNLSPDFAKEQYMLYDNKLCDGAEAADGLSSLKQRVEAAGYRIAIKRGDAKLYI